MASAKSKNIEERHALKNHGLIDTIVQKAKISNTDVVMEISAGSGCITTKLLQKAKKVIAYESNDKLARELQSKVSREPELKNKLVLHKGDVLSYDFPHFDICVSNIPFNISLPAILKIVSYDFRCAYILVQKEVGARLVAKPGSSDYSRLSVIVQLVAQVDHVMKVSKNSFYPAPKVDSCFMKIEPKVPRPPINITEFDNMLKICFGRKNKTLSGNLKSSYLIKKIEGMIDFAGTDPSVVIDQILENINMVDVRSAKMDIEDFLTLLLEFKKLNINFD